jgi:hypothetical protein
MCLAGHAQCLAQSGTDRWAFGRQSPPSCLNPFHRIPQIAIIAGAPETEHERTCLHRGKRQVRTPVSPLGVKNLEGTIQRF